MQGGLLQRVRRCQVQLGRAAQRLCTRTQSLVITVLYHLLPDLLASFFISSLPPGSH